MFKWTTLNKGLKNYEGMKVTYKDRILVWDKKRKEWVVYGEGVGRRWELISTSSQTLAVETLIQG